MARAPRKNAKAKSQPASKLAEALNFISPASKDGGQPFQAHARLAGEWISATDGTFSAGHRVEEQLAMCPHIGRLIDALNRAGTTLALTENENGTLLVKGDKIRATVPCIPGDQLPQVLPDPRIATIDDRIKEGFALLLPLLKADAERVVEISVLLRANSMFSCNGTVIFEYWHGIDLPPNLVLPKTFVQAVAASPKKLEGFGFGPKSVTFYFDDGAWYRTQIYEEAWPDIDKLFAHPQFPAPVPEGLFEAVKAIDSFSKDGAVHFHADKLKTTYGNYNDFKGPLYGATYDVPGLQAGHTFTAKLLRLIESVCTSMDYTSNDDRAFFFSGNVRGCIMKRDVQREPVTPIASYQELPGDATGAEVASAFATVASGGWGTPAPPADPWAGIVGTLSLPPYDNGFGDGLEDEDIPF